MSIAEFSEAMRNRAVNSWFTNEKTATLDTSSPNILVHGTDPYRASEGIAEKNSFIITKETIRGMLSSLGKDTRQTNKIFNKFLSTSSGAGSRLEKEIITIPIKAANGRVVDVEAVHFPSISFNTITEVVNSILDAPVGAIAQSYEKGHVLGLATNLLESTTNRFDSSVSSTDSEDTKAKQTVLDQLNNVIAYYRKLDFASANLQPASTLEVYARSDKVMKATGQTSYVIELQPKAINQASGKDVLNTLGDLRKLFDPKVRQDAELKQLINRIRSNVKDPEFRKQLLGMRSSPSLLDMINKQIRDTLLGIVANQEYHIPMIRVASNKGTRPDTKKLNNVTKQKLSELQKLKKKVENVKLTGKRGLPINFSLVNLQLLLDVHLQDAVSANMGDEGYAGGQRNILNYRTGEFASSVKVERLSLSKEGMITAFYNYMKNPYQAFEPGYSQGTPRSRNPRTLISKSIAEVAALKVSNRMRSVLV